ncbi:MAG: hypothetical protein KDD56_10590, partial [Bdellovibrionales bacterium]|nr:hypothetical protein [Bdellovibrionales bacterium]
MRIKPIRHNRLTEQTVQTKTRTKRKSKTKKLRLDETSITQSPVDTESLKTSIGKVFQAKEGKLGEELGELSELK